MARRRHAPAASLATETVWNSGLTGTGVTEDESSLTVGRESEWIPEHLVLLAAESCFMSTLLTLAAEQGAAVLGYVSNSRLLAPDDPGQKPSVLLSACAVAGSSRDAEALLTLGEQARRDSLVARLLGVVCTSRA